MLQLNILPILNTLHNPKIFPIHNLSTLTIDYRFVNSQSSSWIFEVLNFPLINLEYDVCRRFLSSWFNHQPIFLFLIFWTTLGSAQGLGSALRNHSRQAGGPCGMLGIEPGSSLGRPHARQMPYRCAITPAPTSPFFLTFFFIQIKNWHDFCPFPLPAAWLRCHRGWCLSTWQNGKHSVSKR